MKRTLLLIFAFQYCIGSFAQSRSNRNSAFPDSVATHKVLLDSQSKIISWIQPQSTAYDRFLRDRWNFIFNAVPNSPGPPPRSNYPQYYFYCAYKDQQMIPDTWMNDVGEKIPNWFESARLFYQYTGDIRAMKIIQNMAMYAIDHGTSPANFKWPDFPFTTTNAGDTLFRGFTNAKVNSLVLYEVQVDHAGDMGLTYYKLFLFTGIEKFKIAAIHVADALARYAHEGTSKQSVWPYRVITKNGKVTAPYGANWMGCYTLFDELSRAHVGNTNAYRQAMLKAKKFILQYPMQTGYWTDGHTDTDIKSDTYKSNMSASNATLYMLDHPEFDSAFSSDIPALIQWTEKNFINHCAPGEPANQWGANIVGEQDSFLVKMDYQTARYAAECAGWYALSGDSAYKEKAYRALNWVTYCSDSLGMAFESPLSSGITSWWSDCYGEGPRMFYHALASVPEWAPAGTDHILYSEGVLKNVSYKKMSVQYLPASNSGLEFIKLSFKPSLITIGQIKLEEASGLSKQGYLLKKLHDGDYSLTIRRSQPGPVSIR